MDITKIDKNLIGDSFEGEGLKFFSPETKPIKVFGGAYDTEYNSYGRLPRSVALTVNHGVTAMYSHPSGVRFAFRTNASKIAVRFRIPWDGVKVFTQANAGFDLYVRENKRQRLFLTYRPKDIDEDRYINISRDIADPKEREYIFYAPYGAGIDDISIGINEEAYLKEADEYTYSQPVVFYGSSIVHGMHGARSGMPYPSIISRMYDIDILNLGFSGSAKGEETFAEYIKDLDMCACVIDYDHNAPTPEYLRETHEKFYKIIREANKDLPIIMITRPHFHAIPYEEAMERREIIYTTYKNAKDRGENVYFIDGGHFYDDFGYDDCIADDSHPNVLGLFAMATKVASVLEEALGLERIK